MQIDNSFIEHDRQYRTTADIAWHREIYGETDKQACFENFWFRGATEAAVSRGIVSHVDIGSGGGYLSSKTAPYFEKVIGVEPSKAAVEIGRELFQDTPNLEFRCQSMLEWVESTEFDKPLFITSCAVFTHIPNDVVATFLAKLNAALPHGSILYFYEPYGKNIDVNLWHVRSRSWWQQKLFNFDCKFVDIHESGYTKGIFAAKVPGFRYEAVEERFIPRIFWAFQGYWYSARFGILRGFVSRFLRW